MNYFRFTIFFPYSIITAPLKEPFMLTESQYNDHVFKLDSKIKNLIHTTRFETENVDDRLRYLQFILKSNLEHIETFRLNEGYQFLWVRVRRKYESINWVECLDCGQVFFSSDESRIRCWDCHPIAEGSSS